MKLVLNIFLLVMLALPAHAFEPQKHAILSRKAASVYNACTGHSLSKDLIDQLSEGSASEDDISLTRVLNWHFYNNGKKIGRYWKYSLHCNGSNEEIFLKHLNALEDLISANKSRRAIYKLAGRIAHHIQEMNSPPHVAPIYHVLNDKFDKYVCAMSTNQAKICMDVQEVIEPAKLFEQAAQNTLKAIDGSVVFDNGKTINEETWRKFWGGPDDNELSGFKTYGEYGNVFGIVPPCKSEVCGSYNRDVFDRFYNECSLRAITDTVRLLIYLDKRIKD